MMMMIEEQLVIFRIKGNLGIAIKKKIKIKSKQTNKQTKRKEERGGCQKKKNKTKKSGEGIIKVLLKIILVKETIIRNNQ